MKLLCVISHVPGAALSAATLTALLLASCGTLGSRSFSRPDASLHGTLPGTLLRHGYIVLDLKSDKTSYRDGESVNLTISASRRSSVKVFNEDAAGNLTMLWPNAHSGAGGILAAGEPTLLPGPRSSFIFRAGPPYGVNTLVAVAASVPFRRTTRTDDFFVDKTRSAALPRKGIAWSASGTTGDSTALTGEARYLYEVRE